jgi:hypothetical protein
VDRRTFLGTVSLAAAGAVFPSPAFPRASPSLRWTLFNATVSPGFSALRQVPLAVYPDGTAIADTAFTTRLSRSAVRTLVRSFPGVPTSPVGHLAGAATNQLDTWDKGHHRTRVMDTVPRALTDCRKWITTHGTAYAPDAVRLIVVVDDNAPDFVPAWPADVPVPTLRPGTTWTQTDRLGAGAALVARRLPHDAVDDWRTYRMPDGSCLAAAWRRLLPGELHHMPGPNPGLNH